MATITSDKLLSFLRKRNFAELGSGLYSDVFAPPNSDRVIKICRNSDPWPNYILWATKNGYAGSFAPKVYSLHILDGEYIATMERLKIIDRDVGYRDPRIEEQFRAWDKCFYDGRQISTKIESWQPGSTKFLVGLREFAGSYGFDLHRGNIMQRSNGCLVVTDPVTGSLSNDLPKRMRARDIAWTRNSQFANQKAYAKA